MYHTPKRNKIDTADGSDVDVSPNNRILKTKTLNIGDKGPVNGSPSLGEKNVLSPSETRRGRPSADLLNTLILEGSTSPSSIKCTYCGRVFPREKSLQAHLRTHTGEKPYVCDYPRCTRKFAQSGQLKTHQRLHTGEKPFICAAPNCSRSFTHANRHCPDHPDYTLKRCSVKPEPNLNKKYDETHNAEVREWLQNWDRRNKPSSSNENLDTTPKKSMFKREESVFSSGSSAYFSSCSQTSLTDDIENSPKSELEDLETSICSNSGSSESEMQSETSPKSLPSELPKKRWLREAVQDQSLWDATNDLACPINWGEDVFGEVNDSEKNTAFVPKIINENQKRPSVLVCVQGGKSKEISSDEIQGAMALVELKNGSTCNFNYRI
ncbi:pair-rule protein odd-paired [Anoplophora glabripennis]|nr:pair-rule protein odd-paired [Anoplophora glabripennis]